MSVCSWQPGTHYNLGDVVEYQGARYKIIQAHTSQGDWAPPVVPALWGRIPDSECQSQGPFNPPDKSDYSGQGVQQPNDSCQQPNQSVEAPHEEEKKKWWDLNNGDHKKQLEIGGGLLAGAAALGAGYFAWHEHEKHKKTEEEKQAVPQGLFLTQTEEFRGHSPRGPTAWVFVEGRDNFPSSAIEAGRDKDNHPIYIARASQQSSLQIGKASPVFREGSAIGYAGKVIELSKFEVLVGDTRAIRWVPYSYQLNLQELRARPVEGGKEANGAAIYIARVKYNGGVHTAKIGEHLPAAHLAFSGEEVLIDDYEVLCYN